MMRFAGLLALLLAAPAQADDPQPQPEPGEEIVFDVFRGDRPFGEHRVSFTEDQGDLIANVEVELRAGVGPITVFRYEHESSERWRDGQLVGLQARTLKDGEELRVSAQLEGDRLIVDGTTPEGEPQRNEFEIGVLPSSHWHGYPASDDLRLINTETGEPMEVRIEALGSDTVSGDGGELQTRRFQLQESLTVDLWYDEGDDWAATAFEARGQEIRYVRRADPDGADTAEGETAAGQ
jgi:hypothetical protein